MRSETDATRTAIERTNYHALPINIRSGQVTRNVNLGALLAASMHQENLPDWLIAGVQLQDLPRVVGNVPKLPR